MNEDILALATGPIVDQLRKDYESGTTTVSEEALEDILPLAMVKWRLHSISNRCYCRSNDNYYRYGGRGITVHPSWRGRNGLKNFRRWLVMMGMTKHNKHFWSVDRIDNDNPYGPDTCKLSTPAEQQRNKSDTTWVTDPTTKERVSLADYCEITGDNYGNAQKRVRNGKPVRFPEFSHLRNVERYSIVQFDKDGNARHFVSNSNINDWVTRNKHRLWEVLSGMKDEAFGMTWFYVSNKHNDKLYKLRNGEYVEVQATAAS